jgi:hypothetical protein
MPKNMHLRRTTQTALAVSAMLLAQSALAQEFIKGGEDKFTLNIGGIVNQFSTSVALNGGTQRGTPIDLEGNGLDNGLSSLQVSGTWRITDRNRVDALYFGANRSGSKTYDRQINIGDIVLDANAAVNVQAKDEFLLLDYRYSFVKNDAYELAGAFAFYGGTFKFNVSGTGSVNGSENASGAISSSSSTTVPLPAIGATLDWYLQPQWKVQTALMGMKAKIGNVDGSVTIFQLGTDYMFTRNLGVGATYLYSKVSADVTKSGFNGNIDWKSNAFLLYATAKF